jgi:hypothetical protein
VQHVISKQAACLRSLRRSRGTEMDHFPLLDLDDGLLCRVLASTTTPRNTLTVATESQCPLQAAAAACRRLRMLVLSHVAKRVVLRIEERPCHGTPSLHVVGSTSGVEEVDVGVCGKPPAQGWLEPAPCRPSRGQGFPTRFPPFRDSVSVLRGMPRLHRLDLVTSPWGSTDPDLFQIARLTGLQSLCLSMDGPSYSGLLQLTSLSRLTALVLCGERAPRRGDQVGSQVYHQRHHTRAA